MNETKNLKKLTAEEFRQPGSAYRAAPLWSWNCKMTREAIDYTLEAMKDMGAAYMANGIVTLAGSRLYTSMADTDEVIDAALERFDKVFSLVKAQGTPELQRSFEKPKKK